MTPTEHDEQVTFVQWFRLQFPDVRILAIPNGTRSSIGAAVKAKREGVSSGVPDLYVPAWKLWIEMKRSNRGTVSSEQKDWISYLQSIGDTCVVAKGCDHAIQIIRTFSKTI